MKNKNLFYVIMLVSFILLSAGCGKKEETSTTLSEKLANNFSSEIRKESDIKKVADVLSQNELIKTKVYVTELNDGDYIEGFQTEIKGFKKAVSVKPIISSIPFIMYIFEVDNAEEFAEELKTNAQLNWNICVTADEMITSTYKNYVFFTMTPKTFDEV